MGKWRTIIVALVFLASLASLVASSGIALWGSADELTARDQLQSAAIDLAGAAETLVPSLPPDGPGLVLPEPDNRRLAALARDRLGQYPGAEGGFYLVASDQFAGAVGVGPGPTGTGSEKEAPAKKDKKGDKKGGPGQGPVGRREPPPLEMPSIRQQALEAAARDAGGPLIEVRDIGPSRVAVAVAPVGEGRPARLVAWVMVRLTGPEQQKSRLARLRLATALSIGGILLALGLVAGLVRSLRRETWRRTELRDELRKAEHLAALGRLLAGVAHEVRNPLAGIRSTVQLWERLPEEARTPASIMAVVRAVDRLDELVGRLLLFAKAGHEVRRTTDLNAVVAETLELLRAQLAEHGAACETDLAPGLPPVSAAGQALRQVVLNLVANALHAIPVGGRVICRTRLLPGEQVELAVADNGPGVPDTDHDRVFEPFYTTRPAGTGLGLALCREVARQHGGDVTLDPPSPVPGATFRLVLPAGERP